MPLEIDYCSAADVLAQLGITTTGTQDNTALATIVTAMSRRIDRYCGRPFGSETAVTRVFDGNGRRHIDLYPDLQSVTSLSVAPYEGQTPTVISSAGYYTEPQMREQGWPIERLELSAILSPWTIFTRGKRTVTITGDWGWAAVPADVKEACIELSAALYKRRLAGYTDESLGDPSLGSRVTKFPPSGIFEMLVPLRRSRWELATTGAFGLT